MELTKQLDKFMDYLEKNKVLKYPYSKICLINEYLEAQMNKLTIKDIKIVWDKDMFAIEFNPIDFHKEYEPKHGQFILKRRKVPRKYKPNTNNTEKLKEND